jgi:hypothetical protein
MVVIGLGIGAVMPNLAAASLGAVAPEDIGKASGIVNTARQVGSVLGWRSASPSTRPPAAGSARRP